MVVQFNIFIIVTQEAKSHNQGTKLQKQKQIQVHVENAGAFSFMMRSDLIYEKVFLIGFTTAFHSVTKL